MSRVTGARQGASVRNALRFKVLHSVVNRVGDLQKLGSEQRLDRFLTYRERLTRVQEIRNYYRARFADLLRLQTGERIAFIGKKSWTAAANLARAFGSIQRNGNSHTAPTGPDINDVIPGDRRKRATAAYSRAIQGYVPGPYRGRVTVVWPSELALEGCPANDFRCLVAGRGFGPPRPGQGGSRGLRHGQRCRSRAAASRSSTGADCLL